MLTINKDSENTLIFTLTEKSALLSPNYLFNFISDVENEQVLFNMTDQSGYPRRFNEFILTEVNGTISPEDPSNGEVTLNYGWGTYEVYESVSPTLVIANTTGRVLEKGKYFVQGYPASFNHNNINNIYQ